MPIKVVNDGLEFAVATNRVGVQRDPDTGAARGADFDVHGGDAPAASNKKGGKLNLYGGRSTGNGGGADSNGVVAWASIPGASGSTLNTNYVRLWESTDKVYTLLTPFASSYSSDGTPNTSPFKFTAGVLLAITEAGAFEYDGHKLTITSDALNRNSIPTVGFTQNDLGGFVTGTSFATIIGTGIGDMTVYANYLQVGTSARLTVSGTIDTVSGGDTVTLRIYVGSAIVWESAPTTWNTGAGGNGSFVLEAIMTFPVLGASVNFCTISGFFCIQNEINSVHGRIAQNSAFTGTFDTAADNLIDVHAAFGTGSGSNELISYNTHLTWKN